MINRLLDLVACSGTICGGDNFGRWAKSLQDDDAADLWKDLTLQSGMSPPVPTVIQFPACEDDVSALCNPYFNEVVTNDQLSSDLELRADTVDTFENDSYIDEPLESVFEGMLPPKRLPPLHEDCDGSSYSSCNRRIAAKRIMRRQIVSWQSEAIDATTTPQTRNHSLRVSLIAH
jgi:hypothetical protein